MKIDIHSPRLSEEILKRLKGHTDWVAASYMARKNSHGPLYIVGGKVYRLALELVHGINANWRDGDWDFLADGELCAPWRAECVDDWEPGDTPYYYEYSIRFTRLGVTKGPLQFSTVTGKIDLMSTKDFGGDLEDYYYQVPLKIQAISLNLSTHRLSGPGLKDIGRGVLTPNNPNAVRDFPNYATDKATSLGIHFLGNKTSRVPCDCFYGNIFALMNFGCQRKDIHV